LLRSSEAANTAALAVQVCHISSLNQLSCFSVIICVCNKQQQTNSLSHLFTKPTVVFFCVVCWMLTAGVRQSVL